MEEMEEEVGDSSQEKGKLLQATDQKYLMIDQEGMQMSNYLFLSQTSQFFVSYEGNSHLPINFLFLVH
jgi:hypothetical protein